MADVAKLVAKADEAAQKRNYDYAVELYLQAVTLEPDHAGARKALRAVELKRATEMGTPAKPVAFLFSIPTRLVAALHGMTKNFDKQAIALEGVMARDPRNTGVALKLAHALYKAGSKNAARAVFEAIPEWDGGSVAALKGAGQIAREQKEFPAALALFQRARGVSPNDKDVNDAIRDISATQSIGHREGAGSYRDVLKDQKQASDLARQAKLEAGEAEVADSVEGIEAALQKKPGDLVALRRLARLYEQARATGKAIDAYQRILRIEPHDFDAGTKIAELTIVEHDRRIAKLEQLVRSDAKNAQAKADLEKARAVRTAFEVEDLTARVAAHPTETPLRFKFGVALHRAGRFNDAVGELQQTRREPMLARDSAYWLGRCFLDLGKMALAVKQFETALAEKTAERLDETAKEAHYFLGKACLAQQDAPGARKHFERIYEEDINHRDVARLIEAG